MSKALFSRLKLVAYGRVVWKSSVSTMPPKRKSDAGDAESNGETKGENGAPAVKKGREAIPDVSGMDFSSESKTPDGKPWNMKFASWNVNGIRAWMQKNAHSYITAENPDIFCVQETKCEKEKIPKELAVPGYHVYWLSGDKDGYSGTGLYSKKEPLAVSYGIGHEEHDKEGRVITAEYEKFYFVTVYVPNAGRKLVRLAYREKWDPAFRDYLVALDKKKPVVVCGDFNVSHLDIDLKNAKNNKKCAGFTQEERDGFTQLLDDGFIDSFRQLYPDKIDAYTFWTFMMNCRAKNVGWRLDYFLLSKQLKDTLCDSVIRSDVMGSDHCPIVCLVHL